MDSRGISGWFSCAETEDSAVIESPTLCEAKDGAPQFHWAVGFTRKRPIRTPAADFIIESLRTYPHEVNLFPVGPAPNLADVSGKIWDAKRRLSRTCVKRYRL